MADIANNYLDEIPIAMYSYKGSGDGGGWAGYVLPITSYYNEIEVTENKFSSIMVETNGGQFIVPDNATGIFSIPSGTTALYVRSEHTDSPGHIIGRVYHS